MIKRCRQLFVIICICLLLTACSEASTEADDNAAAGTSGTAVSDMTVTTVRPEELPDKWMARGYMMNVAFMIKERTHEGYRATVEISKFWGLGSNLWRGGDYPDWEICLELKDEITDIAEAEIVSRKGMEYTIRGTETNRDYHYGQKIQFDIAVRCPDGAHEPGICYFKRENSYMPEQNYKFEVLELVEEGEEVQGTLKLTNCSEQTLEYWQLEFGCNFTINSLDGARIFSEADYTIDHADITCAEFFDDYEEEEEEEDDEEDDDESIFSDEYYEKLFSLHEEIKCYNICGRETERSLRKGESVEISFTGKRAERKPKVSGAKYVLVGNETDISWGIIEKSYGAKYGKIEKYLVADSVAGGVDLFFVFDEKGKDSYTAIAELTNILKESDACPDRKIQSERMLEIAEWEICLECEDTIEEIEGAEIIAHEGNVYRIRAADKNKWIPEYGMETFKVKVSCQGEIHHLGKVYLAKTRYREKIFSSGDKQKELHMVENNSSESFGTRWRTYQELYGNGGTYGIPYYDQYSDTKYNWEVFESKAEEDAFYTRRKWGKKMGR